MSEYTPPWRWARMTKAQVKKYIKDLEEKRRLAQLRLEEAKKSSSWKKEEDDLQNLEDLINEL